MMSEARLSGIGKLTLKYPDWRIRTSSLVGLDDQQEGVLHIQLPEEQLFTSGVIKVGLIERKSKTNFEKPSLIRGKNYDNCIIYPLNHDDELTKRLREGPDVIFSGINSYIGFLLILFPQAGLTSEFEQLGLSLEHLDTRIDLGLSRRPKYNNQLMGEVEITDNSFYKAIIPTMRQILRGCDSL